MDAVDRRLGELGEALDLAREILADPLIRAALAERSRTLAAGAAIVRLVAFGLVAQTALLASRPSLVAILREPAEPEPRDAVPEPEPGRATH